MKMEKIQNAQTISAESFAVELADSDLAKVQGGHADGYNSQCYCQDGWGDGSDWGDGNSYYKNSDNNNTSNSYNNDNNGNTNLNLLGGLL